MQVINYIVHNGALWAVVGVLIYIYETVRPVLKSHLRNNHEKSLLASADRAVAIVTPITEASPTDRENEGISLIVRFANKRGIPITLDLAKAFFNQALTRFKANGGKIKEPLKVSVNSNGEIQEKS